MTDDQIRARRRARDIVTDLRWLGIAIPPLYRRMADEFTALAGNGEYARWLASHPSPRGA